MFMYNNWGSALRRAGDHDTALLVYTRAIRKDPKNYRSYNLRGLTYYDMAQYEKAIADFDTCIQLNATYGYAFMNRSCAYYKLFEYAKALQDGNRAVELMPKNAAAYLNRGNYREMTRDAAGACEDWKKAAELGNEKAKRYSNMQCTQIEKRENR